MSKILRRSSFGIYNAEVERFEPGSVITGDNGFKFEFFAPIDDAEKEHQDSLSSDILQPIMEARMPEALPPSLSQATQVVGAKIDSINLAGFPAARRISVASKP